MSSINSSLLPSSLLRTLSTAVSKASTATTTTTSATSGTYQSAGIDASRPLDTLASLFSSSLFNHFATIPNQWAQSVLKQPAFAPKDVNMFTPQTYSTATPTVPAAPRTQTESQVKSQLQGIFTKRFCGDSKKIKAGMAVFSDPAIVAKVPDIRLRASLAATFGTAGEGAIDGVKSGTYNTVRFGDAGTSIAQVQLPPGAIKPDIVVSDKYQHENFLLLSPTMAHETLHTDMQISGREELIANALDITMYGQLLNENPSLATSGTELARRTNTKMMARINSRDANGNLRLLTSSGNVYPGGTPLANFAAPFPNDADTPGNPTLQKFLSKVTGQNVTNANFDTATINLLDQNQKLLSPIEVLNVARILKLDIKP